MKKFVLSSFVAFCLSGCVVSEDEIKISELLCKAEGSTVKEINKQGQAVRCLRVLERALGPLTLPNQTTTSMRRNWIGGCANVSYVQDFRT